MKTCSLLSPRLALAVFAVASVSSAPTLARVPPVARPAAAAAIAAPVGKAQGSYIKASAGADGALSAAQTAIRRFTPLHGDGPSIYLVAAVHIGEKSYYKQIQQFLDKQDVVLYEGVRPSLSALKAVRVAGPHASGTTALPAANRPVGLQRKLSDALDLQFQLEGIHYDRPQFRNSDLDWDTMTALAAKAGPGTQQLLAGLGNSLSGGQSLTLTDQIVDKVLGLSASTPFLATTLRRLLITVLSDPDKMRALMEQQQGKSGTLSSAKNLESILVNERNKAVLTDLQALLKTSKPKTSKLRSSQRKAPKPIRSIALFYGAEHMKNMEQHLVSDLGYRPVEVQWLTAIRAAH